MKKALRDHLYAYGRIRGFLTTHLLLSEEVKGLAVPRDLDLYCDFCDRFQMERSPCEHYQLFSTGWKEGVVRAQQIFEQMDLELIRIGTEDLDRSMPIWYTSASYASLYILFLSTLSLKLRKLEQVAISFDQYIRSWLGYSSF